MRCATYQIQTDTEKCRFAYITILPFLHSKFCFQKVQRHKMSKMCKKKLSWLVVHLYVGPHRTPWRSIYLADCLRGKRRRACRDGKRWKTSLQDWKKALCIGIKGDARSAKKILRGRQLARLSSNTAWIPHMFLQLDELGPTLGTDVVELIKNIKVAHRSTKNKGVQGTPTSIYR